MCRTIIITTTEQANAMLALLEQAAEDARRDDYAAERLKPVKRMSCCCCGESYRCRQWWNQDCGHGLGDCCVEFCGVEPDAGESSTYESAMALQGGRRVVLLARMPEVDTIADGDQSLRYVLMSTSHDGSAALYLQPTAVRVVCANTLRLALSETQNQVRIVHTGDVKRELKLAGMYLSQFNRAFTQYHEAAATLATRRYSPEQAQAYMHELFPDPVGAENQPASARTLAAHQKKLTDVRQSFHSASNRLASIRGTWWALFNTITETIDHNQKYRGTPREQGEKRFLDVIEGTAADFKTQAFKLAMSMSA